MIARFARRSGAPFAWSGLLLSLLALTAPDPAGAQERTGYPRVEVVDTMSSPAPPSATRPPRRHPAALALGGTLGGALGFVGGALAGAAIETADGCADDFFCGLGGAIIGATIGEVVMIPVGVHLANGRRGNLGADVLASVGGLAVGALLYQAIGGGGDWPLLVVPATQIAAAIVMERRAERRRVP